MSELNPNEALLDKILDLCEEVESGAVVETLAEGLTITLLEHLLKSDPNHPDQFGVVLEIPADGPMTKALRVTLSVETVEEPAITKAELN